MKPRGKNYERMNKKQKEKTNKTLKRMTKTRKDDSIKLRKNIKDKLEWAFEQKQKGIKAIEDFKNRIQINNREILKLTGIILVLTQLLQETEEKKK